MIYGGPVPRSSGGYLFAKVYLIGREGTANVCVANERDTTAKALAPEIAAAVGLPLEQRGSGAVRPLEINAGADLLQARAGAQRHAADGPFWKLVLAFFLDFSARV